MQIVMHIIDARQFILFGGRRQDGGSRMHARLQMPSGVSERMVLVVRVA